jgi:hypothetical protein
MERVEKQNDMGLESAYDVGVEDMENSDEEVGQDYAPGLFNLECAQF